MIRYILKGAILLGCELALAWIGYAVPMLLGIVASGTPASMILTGIGAITGIYIGLWAIRRIFD